MFFAVFFGVTSAILFVRILPSLIRLVIIFVLLGFLCVWIEDHSSSYQAWHQQKYGTAYVPWNSSSK